MIAPRGKEQVELGEVEELGQSFLVITFRWVLPQIVGKWCVGGIALL